jgi:succinate dehydrogenase / fumarate reductase cytochrome b subunit
MMSSVGISYQTYLFRKLHSLTGLFPAGLFLFFHFTEIGLNIFKASSTTVLLLFWIPFLYHILYGMRIIAHGKVGDKETYYRLSMVYLFGIDGQYKYYRNYLYLFQRLTAYLIVIFVVLHLVSLRTYPHWIHARWYQSVFLLGIISASFHFSNGMFGFLSNWGIITGEKAHKGALVLTFLMFIGLCILGISNFATLYQ